MKRRLDEHQDILSSTFGSQQHSRGKEADKNFSVITSAAGHIIKNSGGTNITHIVVNVRTGRADSVNWCTLECNLYPDGGKEINVKFYNLYLTYC